MSAVEIVKKKRSAHAQDKDEGEKKKQEEVIDNGIDKTKTIN